MYLLLLIPLTVGCALMLHRAIRSRTTRSWIAASIALVITAAGAVMIGCPSMSTSCDLAIIVDDPGLLASPPASLKAALDRYGGVGHLRFVALQVQPAFKPGTSTTVQGPDWQTYDGSLTEADCPVFRTPQAAYDQALAQLRQRSWWRHGAALFGRESRVLFVCSSPRLWREMEAIKVGAGTVDAERAGAAIDLLHVTGGAAPASFQLIPNFEQLVANVAPRRMRESFTGRLASPALQKLEGKRVKWHFNGEIDPTSPDRFVLHAESAEPGPVVATPANSSPTAPGTPEADSGVATVLSGGVIEIRIPLRRAAASTSAPGRGNSLAPGFHLIRCSIEVEAPALMGRVECYLRAELRPVIVVVGNGGIVTPAPAPTEALACQNLAKTWRDVPKVWERLEWTVDINPQTQFITAGEYVERYKPGGTGGPAPFLLFFHDVGENRWNTREFTDIVRAHVMSGTHLMVCGVPLPGSAGAPVPWSDLLPAAARDAGFGGTPRMWRVARRPQLRFVLDPSVAGHFKTAFTAQAVENPAQRAQLSDALDAWQLPIVRDVLSRLSINTEADGLTSKPAEWVDAKCLDGAGNPTATDNPAKAAGPDVPMASAVDWRLTPLVTPAWINRIRGATPPATPIAVEDTLLTPHDVVVLFCCDVNQKPQPGGTLAALLARGVSVIVVKIRSPHLAAINREAVELDNVYTQPLQDYLSHEKNTVVPWSPVGGSMPGRLIDAVDVIDLSLTGPAAAERAKKIATGLAATAAAHFKPKGATIAATGYGRVIGEQLPRTVPADQAWAAPRQFQLLTPVADQTTFTLNGAVTTATTNAPIMPNPSSLLVQRNAAFTIQPDEGATFAPWARGLIYSRTIGQAIVVALGYSPFEQLPELHWPSPRPASDAIFKAGSLDAWGPQRLLDFSSLTAQLEPVGSNEPRIRSVSLIDRSGRLRLEVTANLRPNLALPELSLRCEQPAVGTTPPGTPGASAGAVGMIPIELVDVDTSHQSVIYEVHPERLADLLRGPSNGQMLRVMASMRAPVTATTQPSGNEKLIGAIFVPSVDPQSPIGFQALSSVAALAGFTGGSEAADPADIAIPSVRLHLLASAWVVVLLGGYWGWSGVRWLRMTRARRAADQAKRRRDNVQETSGQTAQGSHLRRFDPRNLDETTGRRGYDGRGTHFPNDVLLSLANGEPTALEIIAHDIPRFCELLVLVHVGPSGGATLHAAGRVACVLAGYALAARMGVSIQAVGGSETFQPLGPFHLPPSDREIFKYLRESSRHISWASPPTPPRHEAPFRVIYVSDMQYDDPKSVQGCANAVREAGGRFAAVMVARARHQDASELLLDPGRLTVLDRREWSADDHRATTALLAATFEKPLAAAEGEWLVVNEGLDDEALCERILNSTLMRVLE